MKYVSLFFLALVFAALPTLAQDELSETYTLDTGTTIDYPGDWDVEESDTDDVVIFSLGTQSRAIVLDYPIVSALTLEQTISLEGSIQVLARELLNVSIGTAEVENFDIDERDIVRYDASGQNSRVSFVAVRFRNDTVGMIISIGIDESTLIGMVASFDNVAVPQMPSRADINDGARISERPGVFIFQSGGRFTYPAQWVYRPARVDGLEYVALTAPDESLSAITIGLSDLTPQSTPLRDVFDAVDLDFEALFGLSFQILNTEEVHIGDHSGVHYELRVTENGQRFDGELVIVRYNAGGFGLALYYGAGMDRYAAERNLISSSLNNSNHGLQYLN